MHQSHIKPKIKFHHKTQFILKLTLRAIRLFVHRFMSKMIEVCLSSPKNYFDIGIYMFVRCSYAENLEISRGKGDSIVNISMVLEVSFNTNHQNSILFLYILLMRIRTTPRKDGLDIYIFMCHFSLCHIHVKKFLFLLQFSTL